MNETERKEFQRKQRLQNYQAKFGLDVALWDKYRLERFEILSGNEDAFRLACQFLTIPPELKPSEELFKNDIERDAWYERQPVLHHFLTFCGDCGRGKTHLALGLGIWAIEMLEVSAIYCQVSDLLAKLRASFGDDSEESYHAIMNRCKYCDLLILDDLGMQKNTDWALEQLDSLIDFRYMKELQTVFTTNVKPSRLSSRIASRLKEGEITFLTCGDFRELIAKRRLEKRQLEDELRDIIKQ